MTPSEIARLLELLVKRWPYAPLPTASGDVWLEDLADVPAEEATAAVTAFAKSGERFPPTSGWVCSEIERAAQATAPSAEDGQRLFARIIARCAPYGADSPEATAITIERMAVLGVHEALLRWVQTVGVYAIRMMPDPDLQPLDPNQVADRRDRFREYDRRVLPDWRADPRPGVALSRARVVAGIDGGRSGLQRPDFAGALLPGSEGAA